MNVQSLFGDHILSNSILEVHMTKNIINPAKIWGRVTYEKK